MLKKSVMGIGLAIALLAVTRDAATAQVDSTRRDSSSQTGTTTQDTSGRTQPSGQTGTTTPRRDSLNTGNMQASASTSASASTGVGMTTMSRNARGGATGRDLALSAARSVNHTVLFRALRLSGLTEQAAGKGPYTVFAPTDEAFAKMPTGSLEELLKPANKAKLVKLLSAHVVKGKFSADQLQDGQSLKTLTGATLTVSKQGESVVLTDAQGNSATVTQSDIEATNGMIHAVDGVLAAGR